MVQLQPLLRHIEAYLLLILIIRHLFVPLQHLYLERWQLEVFVHFFVDESAFFVETASIKNVLLLYVVTLVQVGGGIERSSIAIAAQLDLFSDLIWEKSRVLRCAKVLFA